MPNIFSGNLHGIILYPASHAKPEETPHATNDEIQQDHYEAHTNPPRPLHFELPHVLSGAMTASPHLLPWGIRHNQAAARLFAPEQREFATAADLAARHYLGLNPDDPQDYYTHLHGIGSWENKAEPAMATVFHKPTSALQLMKIGADVGTFARQHGILVFSPHQGGAEQLMHMRVPTHSPLIKKLSPGLIADISRKITGEFHKHYNVTGHDAKGNEVREPLMPGRSYLPDTEGHTDVLVWVPPWEKDPERLHDAFNKIGESLHSEPAQYWPGTGAMLGGTSPYSDEEKNAMNDKQKREAALANYERVRQSTEATIPEPEPTEPYQLERAPSGTGIVIRGVFYRPGMVIPDLISPSSQPPQAPAAKMSREDFTKRLRIAYTKHKEKGTSNAHDDSQGTGSNGSTSPGANGSPARDKSGYYTRTDPARG